MIGGKMKSWKFYFVLIIILTACTPSEAQIQEALEQTQAAQPTITKTPKPTLTPEPTNTPTIEPSPTPNYKYLREVNHEELLDLLTRNAIFCDDQELNNDGNYEQSCSGIIKDGLVSGEITGNSQGTVAAFSIIFTPFKGSDISDRIEETFLELVSFGENADDMQSWIENNLEEVLNSKDGTLLTSKLPGIYLMMSGQNGVVLLGIIATE
jgi:hypothetical protein